MKSLIEWNSLKCSEKTDFLNCPTIRQTTEKPDLDNIIKAEVFYFLKFKETYKVILKLSRQGKTIDFVSVLNQVTANSNYSRVEMKKLLWWRINKVDSLFSRIS